MNSFKLKIIAIVSMVLDHTGKLLLPSYSFLPALGRIAFPIFSFQISQGYIYTKNIKRYLIRLFIFALISQIPYSFFIYLLTGTISLNVIFTLLFGLISIALYDKILKINLGVSKIFNKIIGITLAIIIASICKLLNTDYGFYGVFLTFMFYLFKDSKIKTLIGFILLTVFHFLPSINTSLVCLTFTILSIIPILLYNKKEGIKLKYFFYIFYPLHLSILLFIYYITIAIKLLDPLLTILVII